MANPISATNQAQQTVAVDQTAQVNNTPKPAGNKTAAPQDTVTISAAGKAAAQAAQTQQAGADGDHDGT